MTVDASNDGGVAKVVADPLRLRIMASFAEPSGPRTPRAIAETLGVDLSEVVHHVRSLARAGMIELVKAKVVGGAVEHTYSARDGALAIDHASSGPPRADVRFSRREGHFSRTTVIVDDRGFDEITAFLADTVVPTIERITTESDTRLGHANDAEPIRAEAVLLLRQSASSSSRSSPRPSLRPTSAVTDATT